MEVISSETICSSGRISLIKKTGLNSDGLLVEKPLIQTPDAVTIIPYLDNETIVLIKNYRLSLEQFMWEFPAGTNEEIADNLDCAKRELQEETGYIAKQWQALFSFYPVSGLSSYQMHCFEARDLKQVGQNLDDNEMITVHPVKIKEAFKMLDRGDIQDAKTQLLLYYLKTKN